MHSPPPIVMKLDIKGYLQIEYYFNSKNGYFYYLIGFTILGKLNNNYECERVCDGN